ncbi:aldehyde dehydrogenase family protein [Eubacterium sp. AB3007]|jgi:acyl-CoA reductase-like NAD-dependent aldehyde dehydrogenase|uniref:aldehyde dehydrogenase family protein n=1 Tax=Eubacterium sp. AB3007 TaxID=1392487 RepID=UPI00068EC039|nr:aldehyde dehydrogenase family protein [Eubacterium sp. AB3007]
MNFIDNDLLSVQEARILAEDAHEVQAELASFSQEKLDTIVEAMVDAVYPHIDGLAVMSSDETGYGYWKDKYAKNRFVCDYLRKNLRGMRCVGVIGEDQKRGLMDVGVPVGVIAALVPATSPVSTTIYNAMIAIKAGNPIVFSPHPAARATIGKALDIMIDAAVEAGLPEGALAYLNTVAESGTVELMNHRDVSLIMITGVPGMLDKAYEARKPLIYGGAGNGPAFIERTADIPQAVRDIVSSKTFDNGLLPAAEQSIVVDGPIADQVRAEFRANHAYFMTSEESKALAKNIFNPDGSVNTALVGVTAGTLARRAGFTIPEGTVLLVSEEKFASQENPYTRDKLAPVVAFFVEDDWKNACEKCIELLITENHGHTMVIHSMDGDVIRQFALRKPVARVLVNTSATFGSMGASTNLFPAMTLGSGASGHGITTDNVSPMNLIYVRKVGFGVRDIDTLDREIFGRPQLGDKPAMEMQDRQTAKQLETLQAILSSALEGENN